MTVGAWVAFSVCGGLGAVARYVADTSVLAGRLREPLARLTVINVVGSLLLGVVYAVFYVDYYVGFQAVPVGGQLGYRVDEWSWLLVRSSCVGFLGGFTTFSTVMVTAVTDAPLRKSLGWLVLMGTLCVLAWLAGCVGASAVLR
ncbi:MULTISPECIES: CrcB family protein [Corynebacterium]|uniref:fluoride efflux transporter FluC n=1 Tax=Corynebacterium TaxID=1716 RepID=UPI0018657AF4|nr:MULTISPECIES: CrcB family protein [Corynebacterium]